MSEAHSEEAPRDNRYIFMLTLGALGVVYGDIGTSPLYAMRECFVGAHGVAPTKEHIIGVLSLIIWSLISVVSIKYLVFVMRADNRGEGGILALLALILPHEKLKNSVRKQTMLMLGLFGAALLYGDGTLTPAISVLSAVEGLIVIAPVFSPIVVPLTIGILVALFFFQRRGSAQLGAFFAPVICVWFITLGLLDIRGIMMHPTVLAAVNPLYGLNFVFFGGAQSFKVLGAVFLVVTGSEALYADMGHFGKLPIRLGWFCVVLPALVLNYFGQGGLILEHAEAITNPFFQLAPAWALFPLVLLATMATVIASQALITGAFSLTRQAVQLGYLPRVQIDHTSSREMGQIYIPLVNYALLTVTIFLVLAFRSSSRLATAYGIAVSLTMLITTVFLCYTAYYNWKWKLRSVLVFTAIFLIIDLHFFGANLIKVIDGGWVPLVMAAIVFTIMTTWWRGRQILAEVLSQNATPLEEFIDKLQVDKPLRVPGTAIFMSRDIDRAPTALLHNLRHNKILHSVVILLRVVTEDKPSVSNERRIILEPIREGFYRLTLRYGFMEDPDVPGDLGRCSASGLLIDLSTVTYFLGRESILPTENPGMALWRENLFSLITRVAARATSFFKIPPEQVIEIGYQVEI